MKLLSYKYMFKMNYNLFRASKKYIKLDATVDSLIQALIAS